MATFLTAADVALRWQCSEEHVTRLARSRQLRAMKSGRLWRFREADLEVYEAAHTSEPAPKREPTTERGARGPEPLPAALELDGDYAAVVKGPVPWRPSVIGAPSAPSVPAARQTRKARARG